MVKAEIGTRVQRPYQYPILLTNGTNIIYAISEETDGRHFKGVRLIPCTLCQSLVQYSTSDYAPFNGSITLSNE